jgi:hypothetical protein
MSNPEKPMDPHDYPGALRMASDEFLERDQTALAALLREVADWIEMLVVPRTFSPAHWSRRLVERLENIESAYRRLPITRDRLAPLSPEVERYIRTESILATPPPLPPEEPAPGA